MSDEILRIRRLIETARLHPGGAMPTESHQSLPVPLLLGDAAAVGFLFAPTRLQAGAGLWVFPPTYRAVINARTGTFDEMRRVGPADFSLDHDPGRALGTYGLAEGVTAEQYLALKERLLDAYDALLPWFFSGDPAAAHGGARRLAEDFRNAFAVVGEGVLRPYYRAFGRQFFTWIDSLAA
jgi:hypothetical protein